MSRATGRRPVAYGYCEGVAQIEILSYPKGRSTPFSDWLHSLRDVRAVAIVRARLNRIRLGNFGDCRSVGGDGEELRIDFGPGYRVCYRREGSLLVVLLGGADKRSQRRRIA